jgi:hypothetical protein
MGRTGVGQVRGYGVEFFKPWTRPAGTRVRDESEKMLAQFFPEFSGYAGLNHYMDELNPQILSGFYYSEIDVKV